MNSHILGILPIGREAVLFMWYVQNINTGFLNQSQPPAQRLLPFILSSFVIYVLEPAVMSENALPYPPSPFHQNYHIHFLSLSLYCVFCLLDCCGYR